jgi:signal transduction histidine kinase
MLGRSLRSRVFAALITISLLPLFISAYQGYHCGRMAVMDVLQQQVLSSAEARRRLVTNWLDERIRDTATLVSPPLLAGLVEEYERKPDARTIATIRDMLETFKSTERTYESLSIFDTNWNLLISGNDGSHSEETFAESDFRERVQSARGVYMGTAHPHVDGGMGCHLGSPILNRAGATIGYLAANLNLTAGLSPLLLFTEDLGLSGGVYLLDHDLRPISTPAPGAPVLTLGSAIAESPSMSGHTAAQQQNYIADGVIGAALPVSEYGWRIVVEIDMEKAMAPVTVLLIRATVLVAGALFAVLLLATWLSRILGRPLSDLASIAHRISEGHSSERLGPMSIHEADEVRRAFNHMLDDLRDKEEVIVRSAKLAAVGELTSRVVHEIRNPLSSIKMNLQALMKSVELDPENGELAAIASGQVKRLEYMLNQLLLYGRPIVLARSAVAVDCMLHSAAAELHAAADEKCVEISIGDSGGGILIDVDVDQFTSVLINLLRNAIEASPDGSSMHVEARQSTVHPEEIEIEVADRGSGVRPEHLEMLFKPFFTTKSGGTGLGLANVRKIVELHGGRILATSQPANGTTFVISLPRVKG